MSIERRERKSGPAYRVAWRDEMGVQRSRTFPLKRDAQAFEATIVTAKRQGELGNIDAGQETLKAFTAQWWSLYAEPSLAATTIASYARLRDNYILPKLGHLKLRTINPPRVNQFAKEMSDGGAGAPTVRRTLALLQGILERAVEWGHLQRNPVRSVRKPKVKRKVVIEPLSPKQVESLRAQLFKIKAYRDAVLISVLAYAGLRPGEALALRWSDVRARTIVVDKALAFGEEKGTKTHASRSVRLMRPLSSDLKQWRRIAGNPDVDTLIFPTRDGDAWGEFDYRNWRRRRFKAAAAESGLPASTRPYDLRHSFASLLLAEQINPVEIASQLGHSLQTLFNTYAHVIEDLRGAKKASAENRISAARRSAGVAQLLPKAPKTAGSRTPSREKNSALAGSL